LNKKTSLPSSSLLSTQNVVVAATFWAVLALLFFLTFSTTAPGEARPDWYQKITYILENMAFLAAGFLCLRNWRSSQIVSGGTVWLALGLGMLSYFIGNLLLAYWEVGLGQEPAVSPGDFFFILTYMFLGWGMLRAVISRELNLTPLQWGLLSLIAVGGVVIAIASGYSPADTTAWALALEEQLAVIEAPVKWLYIVGDVILVVMASTLLLAFWGGRFAVSWRFIALSAFSFYIADIWFNYATNYIPDYQTGALPEVFWIFSPCLVAIGAALEHDLSTRRQGRRRRN
jgi:hypothetical protein